jgi:hypothetical protein
MTNREMMLTLGTVFICAVLLVMCWQFFSNAVPL